MALRKTEHGRLALQSHSAGLSLAERRALILCDGQRNRAEVVALLGAPAVAAMERLLRENYLHDEHASAGAVTTLPKRVAAVPAAPVAPSGAAIGSAALASTAPSTSMRRSLAASKLYMLDMLQLQRDPASATVRAQIQASANEAELVARLTQALRHLHEVATTSYAQRVCERLAEILPEAYLPTLLRADPVWRRVSAA